MSRTVAYLGPEGTYSEEAALAYAAGARRVACDSIRGAVRAVERGEADEAVVPIENSLEGAVTETTDLLIHETPLKIKREIVVPIRHCLVLGAETDGAGSRSERRGTDGAGSRSEHRGTDGAGSEDAAGRRAHQAARNDASRGTDGTEAPGFGADIGAVEIVFSHPQAAAQCRSYLERHLPGAAFSASLSTAAAVQDMLRSGRRAAAVSSRRAAELFGARVVASGIEDGPRNQTRFVALADEDAEPTGRDKTSICFDFSRDGPGILHGALGELASRGINMLKIESRPDKASPGRYFFLLDLEGHRTEPVVESALAAIAGAAGSFKVLGSYPRAD